MAGLGKIAGVVNPTLTSYCAKARIDITNGVHSGGVADATGLGVVIPNGAIVTRVIGSVVSAFLNPATGATIAINIGATEVNAATAFDSGDYTAVDVHYSTPVKLAADSEVNIDIAASTVTAGIYDIYIEYLF
jgi:hypothetical protein